MERQIIEAIDVVSDGIVVQFRGGVRCYFPASFLLDNVNTGSNQLFLDYNPTPEPDWDVDRLEALCALPAVAKPRVC